MPQLSLRCGATPFDAGVDPAFGRKTLACCSAFVVEAGAGGCDVVGDDEDAGAAAGGGAVCDRFGPPSKLPPPK